MSGGGKTPTFCVFPVFSVAVMEKCCDACGDGNTISCEVFRRQRVLFQHFCRSDDFFRWVIPEVRWGLLLGGYGG
jgi:hypothetical protein